MSASALSDELVAGAWKVLAPLISAGLNVGLLPLQALR